MREKWNQSIELDGKYNQHIEWDGFYRGIRWRIIAKQPVLDRGRRFDWCHYISIGIDNLPEAVREQFWLSPKTSKLGEKDWVHYDYSSSPLGNLEWHGGITYYEKICGFDGSKRAIEAGCDYMHLWDENQEYSFSYVLCEVKATIDSLHEQIKGIGIHCTHGYCHKESHLETDGVYWNKEDKDTFICNFCEAKRQKEIQEAELLKSRTEPKGE